MPEYVPRDRRLQENFKGGAIRRLTSGLDPRHVRVVPISTPTPEELRRGEAPSAEAPAATAAPAPARQAPPQTAPAPEAAGEAIRESAPAPAPRPARPRPAPRREQSEVAPQEPQASEA